MTLPGSSNARDQTRRVDEQTRVDFLTDSTRVNSSTRRVRLEQLVDSPNTSEECSHFNHLRIVVDDGIQSVVRFLEPKKVRHKENCDMSEDMNFQQA